MTTAKTLGTTPVWAKSEFWVTAVTGLSGLLLAFGLITKEQSDSLTTYIPNIVGAVLAVLSSFKYVSVQHAAKVEVFRALCAARLAVTGRGSGDVTAQAEAQPGESIALIAQSVGL